MQLLGDILGQQNEANKTFLFIFNITSDSTKEVGGFDCITSANIVLKLESQVYQDIEVLTFLENLIFSGRNNRVLVLPF